jgi:hypothetical protein
VILFGLEIRLRIPTPVTVRRTHAWYCDRCDQYLDIDELDRDTRCHDCWQPARRVFP